jgi:hypothetical protein
MDHDLRQALGYRQLPSSDQREMDLRHDWYQAKVKWETGGCPDSGPAWQGFQHTNKALADYLWHRASADVEADRAKHPKARRNQPVPKRDTDEPSNRVLP